MSPSVLTLQHPVTTHYRWLYSLFLAMDVNFRLKLKSRGIQDPELGSGLAYFVNAGKFQAHLKNHTGEDDVSISRFCHSTERVHAPRDRDLWDRVPRSKPSELETIERLYCDWGGRRGLPSWPRSQEWGC